MKIKIVDEIPFSPIEARIFAEGQKEVLRQRELMIALGILDANGRLISKELPPDMRPISRTEV